MRALDQWPPNRTLPVAALVALLGSSLLALASGCSHPDARRGRVLIVGVDGASHRMIDPMIDAGELPTLAAIRQRGIAGSLRADGPLLSPRIWTSLVTGVAPERHGIENWVWLDADGSPHLYSSRDRRVPALWNIASNAGLEVASVNWLMTHPPERVSGVMVSDHVLPAFSRGELGLAGQLAGQKGGKAASGVEQDGLDVSAVYPDAWRERIDALRSSGEKLSRIDNPFDRGDDIANGKLRALSHFLWETFENDTVVTRMALAVERRLRPDLMLVYLPGIDRTSHLLWPRELYFEGSAAEPTEADGALATEQGDRDRVHFGWLRDYYRYTDDLLAALTRDYGPNDLVVVVSDHGFERAPERSWPSGQHESPAARDGIFYASGPGVRKGRSLTLSMLDLTPSVLAWLGLPVADDMPGNGASFLETEVAKTIPSYGILPKAERGVTTPGDEQGRLDALRLLGYVD